MKKFDLLILGAFMLTLGATAGNPGDGKTVFNVDTGQSKVLWTGKKVTGAHNGTLSLADGKVTVEGGKVQETSVKIDMNTIVCEDITNEEYNKKLVGHLKSDDFFSTEKFPHSEFVATGFKPNAGDNNYTVTGKLTIKGITHEISFPVTVKIDNGQLKANGTAKIDRTKYEIKYGSGSFFKGLGDNMIYDNFEIEFDLVAKAATI